VSVRITGPATALALLLCGVEINATEPTVAHSDNPLPGYDLYQLTQALNQASPPLAAEFARAALYELASAYASEASAARRQAHLPDQDPGLRSWANAVDRLARDLNNLGASVADDTPIRLRLNRDHSLCMLVAGRPVEVDGPRSDDRATLERAVLDRFCAQNPCAELFESWTPGVPDSLTETEETHWSFSATAGPVCTSEDGLEFHFRSTQELRRKRETCAQATYELRALADAINRYIASGHQIDWESLAIRSLPSAESHLVQMSSDGGHVEHYLPMLAQTPELLVLARPWLMARVDGVVRPLVVEDAEAVLSPAGFPGQ
jgi:hypothetical protein